MTEQAGFPLPSQIADVPGAENWRSMYQYFTRFQPDDDKRFWFYNSMHFPEPMPAFDTITGEVPYQAIGANTARLFVFPTTLGIEHRIVNGRVYITANPVLDPAEIERRAAEFGPRAGYYFENWDSLYEGWKDRLRALIAEIESIEVPPLPEWEPADVVFGAVGVAQNHYLQENFHRVLALYSKMWHHHTEMLMLGYGAYVVFFQFCQQAFPEISDQTIGRMVAGIDVIMYRPDDELKGLARLAVELGVDDLFTEGCVAAEVLSALEARGEAGAQWLDAFGKARDPWFHVSSGDGFYHHHLSWNDDLTVPFTALPGYVAAVRAGGITPRPTAQLISERERIASGYRDLLPTDDEKAAFDQMLGLCRLVFPFVEDHKFYCEHWFTTRFFQKVKAFGALLAAQGVLAETDDVFHLHHTEIDQALADVSLAWAAGSPPLGAGHFQPLIAERKRMIEGAEGLVAAAGARPGARGAERPRGADAVGHHQRADRVLAEPGPRRGRRRRGLVRRGRGDRPGAVRRRRWPSCARARSSSSRSPRRPGRRCSRRSRRPSPTSAARCRTRRSSPASTGCPPSSAPATRPSGSGPGTASGSTATAARSGSWRTDAGDLRRRPSRTRPTPARVGGKAASLGELARAGVAVPPGFAVTAEAFAAAWPRSTPTARCAPGSRRCPPPTWPGSRPPPPRFRALVAGAPLPAEVAAAIEAGYAALARRRQRAGDPCRRAADVAVRSSATVEDSAEASFAGLQDTYLGVSGAARSSITSAAAGRPCTTTSRSPTAAASACPRPGVAMAVVVQRMVAPRAAGVMFTRSPVTGDRSVVAIEGTWGLGSALVSGDVTPDSWVISKITGEITGRRVSAQGQDPQLHAEREPARPRPAPPRANARG